MVMDRLHGAEANRKSSFTDVRSSIFATARLRRGLILLASLWFAAAALYYVYTSIDAILRFAPHALYADQWRQYVDYLRLPFPQNIFHPDNGHRLVLPNLLAWIELRWFDSDQWLQICIGILCMLGGVSLAAGICMRDHLVPSWRRAAATFICAFAIFWLGNARTLTHSTELLHTSMPILFLMVALQASLRATEPPLAATLTRSTTYVTLALCAATLATFSFGYGIAVFVSILAVLGARKAPGALLILCVVCMGAIVLLYFGLQGGEGVRNVMTFAPLKNISTGTRWLGAPFVELFKYLLDPAASGLIDGRLGDVAHGIALVVSPYFPNLSTNAMPYAAFGAFGILALIAASLHCVLRREAAAPMQALGLGIAWLGLTAAAIVSVTRLESFHQYPDQVYANRYLPWPCLFWLGLALVALGSPRAKGGVIAKITLVFALLLPILGQPSHHGGGIWVQLVSGLINNTAAGTQVGVVEKGASLGETQPDELLRGIEVLRQNRVAQFATRATTLIGQPVPTSSGTFYDAVIEMKPVDDNLIGPPATAVIVRLPSPNAHPPRQLLLIDEQRNVVGIVNLDARLLASGYSGYARCHPCGSLQVAEDEEN